MTAGTEELDELSEEKAVSLTDGFYFNMGHQGYTSTEAPGAVVRTFEKKDGSLTYKITVKPQNGKLKVFYKVFNHSEMLIHYRWTFGTTMKRLLVQYIIQQSKPIMIGFPLDEVDEGKLADIIHNEIWQRYHMEEVDIVSTNDDQGNADGFIYKVNMDTLVSMFTMMTGETVSEMEVAEMMNTAQNLEGVTLQEKEAEFDFVFTKDSLTKFFGIVMEPVYTAQDEYFIAINGWSDCKNYARKG